MSSGASQISSTSIIWTWQSHPSGSARFCWLGSSESPAWHLRIISFQLWGCRLPETSSDPYLNNFSRRKQNEVQCHTPGHAWLCLEQARQQRHCDGPSRKPSCWGPSPVWPSLHGGGRGISGPSMPAPGGIRCHSAHRIPRVLNPAT